MSPDGHVAEGMNIWMLLSTVCCVCACISTFFYLRVREKYLQRQNDQYARTLQEKEEQDSSSSHRVAKKKRDDLEKMLREMQKEVAPSPPPCLQVLLTSCRGAGCVLSVRTVQCQVNQLKKAAATTPDVLNTALPPSKKRN